MTVRACTSNSARRDSRSRTRTPVTSRACAEQPDRAGAGHHRRAEAGRGAGQGDHQPGVVDLAVVVADRAADRVLAQRREDPPGARRGSGAGAAACPRPDRRTSAGERVVERRRRRRSRPAARPGAAGRSARAGGQRHQDRHRPDQVRREPGGEQARAPCSASCDQAELELLQVAQAAVDQLAGPAGGAGGEVAGLDQGHRQAPGGGVERRRRRRSPRRR